MEGSNVTRSSLLSLYAFPLFVSPHHQSTSPVLHTLSRKKNLQLEFKGAHDGSPKYP